MELHQRRRKKETNPVKINKHSDTRSTNLKRDRNSSYFNWKTIVCASCLLTAVVFCYRGYLETRINTPFAKEKVVTKTGVAVPDRYWGSYRPQLYFGMKTREPYSFFTGIMWYYPQLIKNIDDIRYWCEQADYLKGYYWMEHDGKNFGVQKIFDGNYEITTTFVKKIKADRGGDWTARISFKEVKISKKIEEISLILYMAMENETRGSMEPLEPKISGIKGYTDSLGDFQVRIDNLKGETHETSYLFQKYPNLSLFKETVAMSLKLSKGKNGKSRMVQLAGNLVQKNEKGNLMAVQITFTPPFECDMIFESGGVFRTDSLSKLIFDEELQKYRISFDEKFERIYRLKEKGYNAKQIAFAKVSLSNLIGGVGYFYGSSRVKSEYTEKAVPYWKAALYTAVPSRSFFPRGFLWDEGFHGLIVSTWDLDIELDIIAHWFDMMNVEGWIPREQILGAEALRRVPEEFVTQTNTNANPPAFLLTLRFILANFEREIINDPEKMALLERLYPRLVAWFDWLNKSQSGEVGGTYRWRGRVNSPYELNPKTLPSGLDDYPRASHPNSKERHLDLRCWMAYSASTLALLSKLLDKPYKRFEDAYNYLSDMELLEKHHYSREKGIYADYGLHTDRITLGTTSDSNPKTGGKKLRIVQEEPKLRFVDSAFGYNSLFPLIITILPPQSEQLGNILEKLLDTKALWTDYGLRSLSESSPLYSQWNTENDPPYWRGSIWININYLVLRALRHYSQIVGPHSSLAEGIYSKLRENIVNNIFREYERTGYLWEHYNDVTGRGEGSKPFTGWTSLVTLIMAEIY